MSDHSFNPLIAKIYGVTESIIVRSFVYWTETNAASESNFHEERYWCFGTPEYFTKYFYYLSEHQIKYALKKLIKLGALIKSSFNKKGYDKTNWYSLSDQLLSELNLNKRCQQTTPPLIGQIYPMDGVNLPDGSGKFTQPIPSTKLTTKLITKTTTTSECKNIPPLSKLSAHEKKQPSSSFNSEALKLKPQTDERSDTIFLEHVNHHLENNSDKKLNLYQRRAGVLKILRILFECNDIFNSNGYIDTLTKQKLDDEYKARLAAQEEVHARKMASYQRARQ